MAKPKTQLDAIADLVLAHKPKSAAKPKAKKGKKKR